MRIILFRDSEFQVRLKIRSFHLVVIQIRSYISVGRRVGEAKELATIPQRHTYARTYTRTWRATIRDTEDKIITRRASG